jgi:NADH:ubiquinone oxidoreductase subunit C
MHSNNNTVGFVTIENYLKKNSKAFFSDEKSLWFVLEKDNIRSVFKKLKDLGVYRISCISGVDVGKDIEIIYHFNFNKKRFNIKTSVSKENPEIETVSDIYHGCSLFERELAEMLGIKIKGHPDPRNLFLYKDSPKAPLRRQT